MVSWLIKDRQGVKHLKTELMEFQHDFELTDSSNTVFPIFFFKCASIAVYSRVC